MGEQGAQLLSAQIKSLHKLAWLHSPCLSQSPVLVPATSLPGENCGLCSWDDREGSSLLNPTTCPGRSLYIICKNSNFLSLCWEEHEIYLSILRSKLHSGGRESRSRNVETCPFPGLQDGFWKPQKECSKTSEHRRPLKLSLADKSPWRKR